MKLIIYGFFILLNLSSEASTLKWKDSSFEISFPKTWREVKDLYGIPVTLLGPVGPGSPRAVIQIIPTPIKEIKVEASHAQKFGEDYGEGRKKWVKEQNGEILELLPGKFDDGRLSSGVSYKINNKRYLERTTYIPCPKQLYHLKIVLNFESLKALKVSEDIVRSFNCAK